jgi:hypothetical protein
MKCMHCFVEFHDNEELTRIGDDIDGSWVISEYKCPVCKRYNLFLLNGIYKSNQYSRPEMEKINFSVSIHPFGSIRPPCPEEVPKIIREDYLESCLVLSSSPKASAALSRRCLQNVLRDTAMVKPSDLSHEIQEVIDNESLPSYLSEQIDSIRNIGNFAAHPIKSKNTGEVLPVEPKEAEWNLDVLELIFDFYYVQPAKAKYKKRELNKKLADAGKPPMK